MFRFVVLCGCLMAIAEAGVIGGGLITGLPLAVQPALAYQSNAAAVALPTIGSASSANIIRGIGPVTTVLGSRGLVGAGPGLINGLGVQGLGIGNIGGIGLL